MIFNLINTFINNLNIAPSFLCFLPPPTHNPLPPPSLLPLANAHMSQARACSLLTPMPTHAHPLHYITSTHTTHHPSASPCVCSPLIKGYGQMTHHITNQNHRHVACCQQWLRTATSPMKGPAYAISQPLMTPTCHLITQNQCIRHVMDDNDPHMLHCSHWQVHLPHHHHQQCQQVTAAPEINGLEWGVRKIGKRSGEAREEGMRMQGNGGWKRGLYEPPPFLFLIPVANEVVQKLCAILFELDFPPSVQGKLFTCSVDNGAVGSPSTTPFQALLTGRWWGQLHAAPIFFHF